MTPKEHNRLLGIFLLINAGLQSFFILISVVIYGGLGVFMLSNAKKQDDQVIGGLFLGFVFLILLLSIILILPQIVGGWKLLKERKNARTWGIFGSIVALISIPIGTAAGVYGLWFLCGETGKNFYLQNEMNQNFLNKK